MTRLVQKQYFNLTNDTIAMNHNSKSFYLTNNNNRNAQLTTVPVHNSFYTQLLNMMLAHSNQIHVYVCTILVVIGVIGNIISLLVFFRSARHTPKITTRHSFILLSLSNLVYLVLFWYYSVLPKILRHFRVDTQLAAALNLVHTNVYVCKSVFYSLNVSICINALITVSFSLERAFAVNFPLRARNMRANHHCLFKIIFFLIIVISFVFPVYNLVLLQIKQKQKANSSQIITQCDIPDKLSKLYFKLTLLFVIKTLAIPFLVITVSNISIVVAIYKNKKLLEKHRKQKQKKTNQIVEMPLLRLKVKNNDYAVVYRNTFVKKNWCIRGKNEELPALPKSVSSFSNNSFQKNNSNLNMNHLFASFNSSNKSCSHHSGSLMIKNESLNKLYAQNNLRKHLMVTKMLVPISSSFVLLQLPYFISWCLLAIQSLKFEEDKSDETRKKLLYYGSIVRLTEILNLLYYSIASLLLFSGKTYRKHLYALFCYVARAVPTLKLQREVNHNFSKRIQIVRL